MTKQNRTYRESQNKFISTLKTNREIKSVEIKEQKKDDITVLTGTFEYDKSNYTFFFNTGEHHTAINIRKVVSFENIARKNRGSVLEDVNSINYSSIGVKIALIDSTEEKIRLEFNVDYILESYQIDFRFISNCFGFVEAAEILIHDVLSKEKIKVS
jgi:hypothetical protein